MARDDFDDFDDLEEGGDDFEDEAQAPPAKKPRKKPHWESACMGLAFVFVTLAGVAFSYDNWERYDIREISAFFWSSMSLWPPKVAPEKLVSDGRVTQVSDLEVPTPSQTDRVRSLGVVLDKGARDGVELGQIWTLDDPRGIEREAVICEVRDGHAFGLLRMGKSERSQGGETLVTVSHPHYTEASMKNPRKARRVPESGQWVLAQMNKSKPPAKPEEPLGLWAVRILPVMILIAGIALDFFERKWLLARGL